MSNKIDRERFFVQYWNQKVLYVGGVGLVNVGKGGWNLSHPDFKLHLRSIDSLTDEECNKINNINGYSSYAIISKEDIIRRSGNDSLGFKSIDYLRSIGILVPFAQYSVEEILSLGWAVVKK